MISALSSLQTRLVTSLRSLSHLRTERNSSKNENSERADLKTALEYIGEVSPGIELLRITSPNQLPTCNPSKIGQELSPRHLKRGEAILGRVLS